MKKSQFVICVLMIAASTFLVQSCVSNMLDEPGPVDFCDTIDATYNGDIKGIIDSSCSYGGCHDGAGGIGSGDFTSYNSMQSRFSLVRRRVIEFQSDPSIGMPPDNSVYSQSQKDNLTQAELEAMTCWIDAGFLEG